MAADQRSIQLEQEIKAPPEVIFAAFTKPGDLRRWFADFAATRPHAGGYYLVRWRSGYLAHGRFTAFDKPARIAFTWLGTGEPAETTVTVELAAIDAGTRVNLTHSGFGEGDAWDNALAEARKGWSIGLENLVALAEEGVDLRQARQPFLGVNVDEMNAERAAKEGIGTETGVYISRAIEGASAQKAGLQGGDVIVRLGDQAVRDFDSLVDGLRAYRAGDTVPVEIFRGPERLTIDVELGSRPTPEVPDTPAEVAARLQERYRAFNQALREVMDAASEEVASRQPEPGEWSARETIAHLCWTERDNQVFLGALLVGDDMDLTENPDVVPEKLAALIARYPSIPELMACLERDQADTAALIAAITPETMAYRWRYRQAVEWTLNLPDHAHDHLNQIRAALGATS